MIDQQLTAGPYKLTHVTSGAVQPRSVTSYEVELARILQREAAARENARAREEALRRQMDELIHEQEEVLRRLFAWRADAASRIAKLTPRQRQVMDLVLAGHLTKNIAADLGLSARTVESHRAAIMVKTGASCLPALARLALAAALNDVTELHS